MAIDYDPVLEGETRTAESLKVRANKIVTELNDLDSENVREGGLHRDNFASNTFMKQSFKHYSGTTTTTVGEFPGEPGSSGVSAGYLDPTWSTVTSATGDQIDIAGGLMQWTELQSIDFTDGGGTNIDLKSDNSNGILVLTEQYLYTLARKDGRSKLSPQWTYIGFIVIVVDVEVEVTSGGATTNSKVPISKTVRFCDADTNNCTEDTTWNTQTDADDFGHHATAGPRSLIGGSGGNGDSYETAQKKWVRKNMPIRALITYHDINQIPFTYSASARSKIDNTAGLFKRVTGVRVYGSVKWTAGGVASGSAVPAVSGSPHSPMAEFVNRSLDVMEFNAVIATDNNRSAGSYP